MLSHRFTKTTSQHQTILPLVAVHFAGRWHRCYAGSREWSFRGRHIDIFMWHFIVHDVLLSFSSQAARAWVCALLCEQSDIEASDSDLHGIPIFIRPRRELVVNKQGNAMLYIKHEGALPAFVSAPNYKASFVWTKCNSTYDVKWLANRTLRTGCFWDDFHQLQCHALPNFAFSHKTFQMKLGALCRKWSVQVILAARLCWQPQCLCVFNGRYPFP